MHYRPAEVSWQDGICSLPLKGRVQIVGCTGDLSPIKEFGSGTEDSRGLPAEAEAATAEDLSV